MFSIVLYQQLIPQNKLRLTMSDSDCQSRAVQQVCITKALISSRPGHRFPPQGAKELRLEWLWHMNNLYPRQGRSRSGLRSLLLRQRAARPILSTHELTFGKTVTKTRENGNTLPRGQEPRHPANSYYNYSLPHVCYCTLAKVREKYIHCPGKTRQLKINNKVDLL